MKDAGNALDDVGIARPRVIRTPVLVTVRSHEDLVDFRDQLTRGQEPRAFRLALELDCLTPTESARCERAIERLVQACGCGAGALLGGSCLLGWALVIALRPPAGLAWPDVVGAVVVFFVGALVGKALGLLRARRLLIDELSRLVETSRRLSTST